MLQDLVTLLFRQINIEKHERRTGYARVGIGPVKKLHSLLAIFYYVNHDREFARLDRFLDQKNIGFIVLDNEHMKSNAGGAFIRLGG